MSLALMLVFSALGFSLLISRAHVGENIVEGCTTGKGMFYEIDEIYQAGEDLLCTEKCPCTGEIGETDDYGASNLIGCPGSDLIYNEAS